MFTYDERLTLNQQGKCQKKQLDKNTGALSPGSCPLAGCQWPSLGINLMSSGCVLTSQYTHIKKLAPSRCVGRKYERTLSRRSSPAPKRLSLQYRRKNAFSAIVQSAFFPPQQTVCLQHSKHIHHLFGTWFREDYRTSAAYFCRYPVVFWRSFISVLLLSLFRLYRSLIETKFQRNFLLQCYVYIYIGVVHSHCSRD